MQIGVSVAKNEKRTSTLTVSPHPPLPLWIRSTRLVSEGYWGLPQCYFPCLKWQRHVKRKERWVLVFDLNKKRTTSLTVSPAPRSSWQTSAWLMFGGHSGLRNACVWYTGKIGVSIFEIKKGLPCPPAVLIIRWSRGGESSAGSKRRRGVSR